MRVILSTIVALFIGVPFNSTHGYTPAGDNRVLVWLDSSDSTTLFQDSATTIPVSSDNQPVGNWSDKSGNGWHISAGSDASRPVYKINQQNGRPSVRFDGSSDVLTKNGISLQGSSYTVFAVVRRIADRPFEAIASIYSAGSVDWNGPESVCVGYSDGAIVADARSYQLTSVQPHPGNGVGFMYVTKYDGTYNTAYVNGVSGSAVSSSGSFSAESFSLGARGANATDFNNYEYFEFLIYNGALDDSARAEVENYLGAKYAFAGTQWAPPPPPPPQPPAGNYNPANDSNLALWLDAGDTSKLFQDTAGSQPVIANGQFVGRWEDKSGNGRNLTATSGDNGRPIFRTAQQNGKAAIRFDGTSDSLTTLAAALQGPGMTAFIVARRVSDRSLESLASFYTVGYDWDNPASVAVGLNYGDTIADARDGSLRSQAVLPGTGTAFLYATRYDGTNNTSFVNAVPSASVPSSGGFNAQAMTLGARGQYLADLGNYEYFEVLIFNFALTQEYRSKVEEYLGSKYALPDTQWAPPPPPPPVPPVGPYNPAVDSHVVFWLDASDTNSLFQDTATTVPVTGDAQRVGAWVDKSASDWNVISTAGNAARPLYRANQQNGKGSVRFDGVTNSLTALNATVQGSAYTVFVVARRLAERPLEALLSIHNEGSVDWNNSASFCVGLGHNGILGDVRDGAFRSQVTHPGSGKSFLYTTKYDGTNNVVYLNGIPGPAALSKKSFSAETITLGARGAYLADHSSYEYFEVLIFDFALSEEYMEVVETYLGSKYALPATQWEPPPPPPPQPPAGPYSPVADSRVIFWLDAGDSSTLFQDTAGTIPATANGQLVGQWQDKSANGWDVTAPTVNHRPEVRLSQQNGFAAVRFDGQSDALRTVSANLQGSGYTFFVVGKRLAERSNEAILSVHDEGAADWNNAASAAIGLAYNGNVGDVRSSAFRSQTTHPGSGLAFMYASISDGTNNRVFVNGTPGNTAAMGASFSAETITLGARGAALENFNNYEYYEVLIFDFAMSDAYRQAVEAYLGSKYALPNTPYGPQPLPPPADPVGPYTPAGDSRVVLWLDAADTSTLFRDASKTTPVTSSGQLVGAWADKSAKGWDLTVAGGDDSNKPTFLTQQQNGLPSIRTTGTADWLRTTSAQLWGSNYTFFVVCRRQSDTFQEVIVSIHGSSLRDWDNNYSITLGHEHGDGLLTDVRTDVLLSPHMHPGDGVSFILSSTYNGTQNIAHLNRQAGPAVPSSGRFSSEVITIGSRNNNLEHPNNYDYFEILIYDFALSENYRKAVESYLVNKYGLHDFVTEPETPLPSNPYTPTSDSRVIFWLDSTDSSTLFQNAAGTIPVTAPGQKIGQWRDKSQKGWNVSNAGSNETKPTLVLDAPGNVPTVYFDGIGDVLGTGTATFHGSAYTIFVVGKRDSFVPESGLLSIYSTGMEDWNNNLSLVVGHAATDPGVWWDLRNDTLLSPMPHPGNSERFLYTTKYDGHQNTVYINGLGAEPEESFGYFSAEEIALGARNGSYAFFNGRYYEVLIYNFALSDSYRQAVEQYLSNKYSIP